MSKVDHPSDCFSYACIQWEIRQFALITETQLLISSPKITLSGRVQTQWVIYFDLSLNKDKLLVKLEMLENKNVRCAVQVHWSSVILDENDEGSFFGDRAHMFKPNTIIIVETLSLETLLDVLGRKEQDSLIMKCRMLLNFCVKTDFPDSKIVGIMGLSRNLRVLPTSFLYHDIKTEVGAIVFTLHKAMLYQRSAKIAELIEQSTSDMKVNFNFYDPFAADAIFKYIYTGDIRYIVSYPNLSVPECLEKVDIPELKNIFSKQTVSMITDVQYVAHETNWGVKDLDLNETFWSPKFEIRSSDCKFRLSASVSENEKKEKSLHVFATLLESKRKLIVSIRFKCMPKDSPCYVYQRFRKVLDVKDKIGGVAVTPNDYNSVPELKNFFENTVRIHAYFSIRVGDVVGEIVEYVPPTRPEINFEKFFWRLVQIMINILKSHDYSDFHFLINEEKIEAHKFLVAVRSQIFQELLGKHTDLISVKISDIQSDVFRELLYYMYTGLIKVSDAFKLMDLYNLADQYDIFRLQHVTSTLMLNLINEENMLRVLMFANDKDILELREKTLNFIVSKYDLLEDHPDFYRLKSTRYCLLTEIEKRAHPQSA